MYYLKIKYVFGVSFSKFLFLYINVVLKNLQDDKLRLDESKYNVLTQLTKTHFKFVLLTFNIVMNDSHYLVNACFIIFFLSYLLSSYMKFFIFRNLPSVYWLPKRIFSSNLKH